MPLTAGTRLGPYEIVAPLGAGGMGEVYRATDTRLGRDVAIKVLPADVARDPERLQRFEREAKAVWVLNHPNIVTLYEVGTSEAGPYLVLEKVDGRSLRDVLADGPQPIRRILTLSAQIAEGVAKAHSVGIVHRDLKPDNVMVTADGFAKVLDFGLAKLVFPELGAAPIAETTMAKDTAAGIVLGTLGYLSPEQASGKPADFRADQFALGALMYEMATGERPFKRPTVLESLTATIREEPEPVRSKRPDLPAPFEWLIERCLSKDPNDRYASTSDLARDLASMRDRLSDLTRIPAGEAARPRARVLPRGWLGWAVAAAVIAAIGVGSFVAGRRTAPSTSAAQVPEPAVMPSFRPLTFGPGAMTGARFGSDGKTVYYSVAYGDGPSYVYMTRLDRVESKRLEIPAGFLLSVSARDELAVLLTNERAAYAVPGTLARVPAIGGTPRPLVENVYYADWSADGERIAIQPSNGPCQFPLGRALAVACALPHVSPRGDKVAFTRRRSLEVQNAEGQTLVSTPMPHIFGLAWTRDGREVWFTGSETGSAHDRALYALSLDGRRRLIARAPGSLNLYDVAPDNQRALIVTGAGWFGINAAIAGAREERALDHLGRTDVAGFSADGRLVLLDEAREVSPGTYLRSTDGTQPIQLSADIARGLSPNGAWALVQTRDDPPRLKLVPIGAGTPREVPLGPGLVPTSGIGRWSRDGRRLFVVLRSDDTGMTRVYMREDEGPFRPITPEGDIVTFVASPDGQMVAVLDATRSVTLYGVDGRPPRPLAGENGQPVHWSADGHLYLRAPVQFPARIYRRNLTSGRVEPWRTLSPADPAGVTFVARVLLADDLSYVYRYSRGLNELWLAYDLR